MNDVTQILCEIEQGDPSAAEKLLPLVYEELRKLAAVKLANEKPGQTLQATALVHDAYLRLVDAEKTHHWKSRAHFFAAAAEAMRRVLVDKARRRNRQKHGADRERIVIDLDDLPNSSRGDMLEALDEALQNLELVDGTASQLVKLRFFAGLPMREAGEILGLAPRTADRTWSYAKAWLLREMQSGSEDLS